MHRSLASLATLAIFFSGPAFADLHLVPIDGAHWQPGAGIPGSPNPALGMTQVVTTTGHTEVALLKGLDDTPSTDLHSLTVAATALPSGIEPCWKVYIGMADGSVFVAHLMADSATTTSVMPRGGDFAPYTVWTWGGLNLPAGPIDHVSLQVDAGQQPPPVNDRIAFAGFVVNGVPISKP